MIETGKYHKFTCESCDTKQEQEILAFVGHIMYVQCGVCDEKIFLLVDLNSAVNKNNLEK